MCMCDPNHLYDSRVVVVLRESNDFDKLSSSSCEATPVCEGAPANCYEGMAEAKDYVIAMCIGTHWEGLA